MGMSQERSDNRGDERGMQERLHRTGALGIDLVQTVDRLVPSEAQFDLPAHAVEVGHLPRPDPGWQIREEETIAFRRVDADKTEMQGVLGATHMPIGINGPAIEDEDVLLEEHIEVGPG